MSKISTALDSIFLKLKKVDNHNDINENQIKLGIPEDIDEDRIAKLERNIQYLNKKIDKVLDLLTNKNE